MNFEDREVKKKATLNKKIEWIYIAILIKEFDTISLLLVFLAFLSLSYINPSLQQAQKSQPREIQEIQQSLY